MFSDGDEQVFGVIAQAQPAFANSIPSVAATANRSTSRTPRFPLPGVCSTMRQSGETRPRHGCRRKNVPALSPFSLSRASEAAYGAARSDEQGFLGAALC